jgi:hypothetical protein
MRAKAIRTMFMVLAIGAAAESALAAPILSVSPVSSQVGLGSPFVLDIRVSGVTDLFAFAFDVSFGPAPVRISGVSAIEGAFLASGGGGTTFTHGAFDNVTGTLSSVGAALSGAGPTVSGSGVLASLGFIAIGLGTANIGLSNIQLLDSTLTQIDFGAPAPGVVRVVPEPGTWLLAALGGALLTARRRRPERIPGSTESEPSKAPYGLVGSSLDQMKGPSLFARPGIMPLSTPNARIPATSQYVPAEDGTWELGVGDWALTTEVNSGGSQGSYVRDYAPRIRRS